VPPGAYVSILDMARATLGPHGAAAVSLVYLLLSYTLLVAYISKSGESLGLLIGQPPEATAATFRCAPEGGGRVGISTSTPKRGPLQVRGGPGAADRTAAGGDGGGL